VKRLFLQMAVKTFLISLAFIFLASIQGCKYYYKVKTVNKITAEDMKNFESLNKYLILHHGASAWHISEQRYNNEEISGKLSDLPAYHLKYQTTDSNFANRYKDTKNHNESDVLNEVHLYTADSLLPKFETGDYFKIAFSAIIKTQIYQKAQGRTTVSWLLPVITPIIVIGGLVAITAVTKSSCPLVYIKKGNDYTFAGEIFGGAVYSSLERHDYLPLPGFTPSKHRFSLIISNGLPEVQYINLAELWIVHHPANMMVLPDRQGTVHSFNNPEPPVEALSSSRSDLLSLVKEKDQHCFRFDEDPLKTGDTSAFNTVLLSFPIPAGADTGKLIVKAGNSMWSDYTYGEFTKFFGYNYGAWIKKQGKEPAEKNSRWKLDQRFALMVYLETESGWTFVDYFDLIGPLGARDLIMPVDLRQALITTTPGHGRTIRIKLEAGFKFWDLDYAAMDFSRDAILKTDHLPPFSAITESGKDVAQSLRKNDTLYYIQETTGEEALVVYKDSKEMHGMTKSVFLHTKGYYEHMRDYKNPPDKKQLQSFLIPGRFSRFSYDNHAEFVKNNWALTGESKLP
jgi:hypothetical protein